MSDEINFAAQRGRFFAAFDAPGSVAAVLPERAALDSAIENQILIDDDALPYLVGERKFLAEEAARIMLREAARYGLSGEVRLSKAIPIPEENLMRCLRVHQRVIAAGKQTAQYYDSLNDALMAWTRSLSEAQDKIIEDEILIGLDWDGNVSDD